MVQVSYPGVYIQEVPSGVHTITGVATSIAAFFGRASKGPMNKAIRILSLSDYKRQFGNPHPRSDLANSVSMFFANGGTDCYVIRLAKGADKAAVTLRSLGGQDVLVATAKAEGVWANTVRLEVDYNTPNPDETFNLRVIQEEGGVAVATESFINLSMNPISPRFAPPFVTQSSELIDLELASAMGDSKNPVSFINTLSNSFPGFSQGRRPLGTTGGEIQAALNGLISPTAPENAKARFDISVNDSSFVTVDLRGPAVPATVADIQTFIRDKIISALSTVSPSAAVAVTLPNVPNVGCLLTITSDSDNKSSVRMRRASSNDIAAALMLGVDQGGIEAVRWSNFRPAPTATMLVLGSPGTPGDLAKINGIAALRQDAFNKITINSVDILLKDPNSIVTTAGADPWINNKPVPGAVNDNNDGVREKLRIIAAAINGNAGLPWRAEVWGYHLALLAKEGTSNEQPATITTTPATAVFDNSLVKNVRQYSLGTSGTGTFSTGGVDGNDGVAPGVAEYLGNPDDQTGFHALDPVDLFNLMIIPEDEEVPETDYNNLWGPASNYCQSRRAFLLINAPENWTTGKGRPKVVTNTSLVNDLRATVIKDYSAVFYPNLKFNDNGLIKLIGPSGAIAGIMSRIDSSRGVWKAPSGVEADIRSILGLEVNLTDPENGVLNKLGVNCLRSFPSGFVNWGARTMDGSDDIGSEWKYIPIRRLALFLEESLYRGTKWIVFEPNDEPLWAKIRLNVNAFMTGLFRQGAFQGSTPDKAYYVKCDGETTTQADRNLGIVNIEVGFAPLKPAEFVVIRIQQIAGEL